MSASVSITCGRRTLVRQSCLGFTRGRTPTTISCRSAGSLDWSAWPGAQAVRRAPLAAGFLAGVTAFLLTCLSGHPLLIPEVIYPFWIALGLAVAVGASRASFFIRGDSNSCATAAAGSRRHPSTPRVSRVRRLVVAATTVFVFASIPSRVAREIREVDMTRVTYGFHPWETEETGARYRWTRGRASIHVPSQTQLIEVPMQGIIDASARSVEVDVVVDGERRQRVRLADNTWERVPVQIVANPLRRFQRVDLQIRRTFVPRERFPGSSDSRELGIKVGTIAVASER